MNDEDIERDAKAILAEPTTGEALSLVGRAMLKSKNDQISGLIQQNHQQAKMYNEVVRFLVETIRRIEVLAEWPEAPWDVEIYNICRSVLEGPYGPITFANAEEQS